MSDAIGKNTVSGEQLRSYVERVERIREIKKQATDDEKLVMAEAKSTGFIPKIIAYCVKVRAMKPSDYQEDVALSDMYLSELGMLPEPPLFRAVGLIAVDITAKDQVIQAMKAFVPANGSIIVEAGGVPVRLTRNASGTVEATDVAPKPAPAAKPEGYVSTKEKPPVPDVDLDGAESLGRQAVKDDVPIIRNPFPFGDNRRAAWDLGWRRQAGGDGMGPE